jgi:hypothetical protein
MGSLDGSGSALGCSSMRLQASQRRMTRAVFWPPKPKAAIGFVSHRAAGLRFSEEDADRSRKNKN